jgi:hypothetical protein
MPPLPGPLLQWRRGRRQRRTVHSHNAHFSNVVASNERKAKRHGATALNSVDCYDSIRGGEIRDRIFEWNR